MPVMRISIGDVVKHRLDDLEVEINVLRDAYIALALTLGETRLSGIKPNMRWGSDVAALEFDCVPPQICQHTDDISPPSGST
jgi:hypothetical protein